MGWIFSSNFLTREAAGEKSNHFSLRLSGPFYFFNSLISVVKSKIQQLMKIIKIYTIWAAHKLLPRTVVVIPGDSLVWLDWCRDPPRNKTFSEEKCASGWEKSLQDTEAQSNKYSISPAFCISRSGLQTYRLWLIPVRRVLLSSLARSPCWVITGMIIVIIINFQDNLCLRRCQV